MRPLSSSLRDVTSSSMRKETSWGGRSQFSVENAYTVRASTPSWAAVCTVLFRALTPARCPAARGRPRSWAQRPLPSMMMATCRGKRAGSMAAARGDSSLPVDPRSPAAWPPSLMRTTDSLTARVPPRSLSSRSPVHCHRQNDRPTFTDRLAKYPRVGGNGQPLLRLRLLKPCRSFGLGSRPSSRGRCGEHRLHGPSPQLFLRFLQGQPHHVRRPVRSRSPHPVRPP